jgi:pimeloyl-ACP methyl ester carboxylesterase
MSAQSIPLETEKMETHTFRGTDGVILNCLDYGGAGRQPLLLVHGGSAHAHWWDFVAPTLTDRFHVLALDLRGHGDSAWTADWAYGTRHYVADLEAVIGSWSLGAPVLVGHSMGGHTLMVYASQHSQTLRAMVVIDSPATYPAWAVERLRESAERPPRRYDSLAAACAKFRPMPPATVAAPEVLRHVASYSFRQDEEGKWVSKGDRRTLVRDPIDAWEGLSNISCPALYVRGDRGAIEPQLAQRTTAAMGGSLVEIPNSQHHVMLDNPTGLARALHNFLDDFA